MYELTETTHRAHAYLSSHRHERAYIAIPLEGRYQETSIDGRFSCEPGVAIVHGEWHVHADHFGGACGRVLNIGLPRGAVRPRDGSSIVALDVIEIEKLARRDAAHAARAILEMWQASGQADPAETGWMARFMRQMRAAPRSKIEDAAADVGVSREYLARRIKGRLGVAPSNLRSEWRFRLAAELLARGESLAAVSASAGYADQSHMTRDFKARCGKTPAALRDRL